MGMENIMIVVTGSTGNVGRILVRMLAPGHMVTAVSRTIQERDVPAGIRTAAADLGDPASLDSAFKGAKALFLIVAGKDPDGVLARARAAGITRVVLISSQGVGTRTGGAYAHAAWFERAVADSGLEYTILRTTGLNTTSLAWADPIRAKRVAPAPFGEVALPFVDPEDVAAVAAEVLTGEGHHARRTCSPAPRRPRPGSGPRPSRRRSGSR